MLSSDRTSHSPLPVLTRLQIPWIESPIIYDVRAKPRNIASLTGTKDLQMVRDLALDDGTAASARDR
jgi:hypothetical protein